MTVKGKIAVLAAYITIVGAMLAAKPTPAFADCEEGSWATWIQCLEALAITLEQGGEGRYCDDTAAGGCWEIH